MTYFGSFLDTLFEHLLSGHDHGGMYRDIPSSETDDIWAIGPKGVITCPGGSKKGSKSGHFRGPGVKKRTIYGTYGSSEGVKNDPFLTPPGGVMPKGVSTTMYAYISSISLEGISRYDHYWPIHQNGVKKGVQKRVQKWSFLGSNFGQNRIFWVGRVEIPLGFPLKISGFITFGHFA